MSSIEAGLRKDLDRQHERLIRAHKDYSALEQQHQELINQHNRAQAEIYTLRRVLWRVAENWRHSEEARRGTPFNPSPLHSDAIALSRGDHLTMERLLKEEVPEILES